MCLSFIIIPGAMWGLEGGALCSAIREPRKAPVSAVNVTHRLIGWDWLTPLCVRVIDPEVVLKRPSEAGQVNGAVVE